MIEGTTSGMMVEADGSFALRAAEGQNLVVGMLGYESRLVRVTDREEYLVVLRESATELEEVTVVAFSKQKKESVISSVSTVRPSELKVPSSNLTTVLGGRIAGIISQQISGEPGRDNADFFVRGVTTFNSNARGPLILIDNVELSSNDLARLQPDDIASFSILKDATATALYGARGANGVILVTTKEGREGKAQLNVRFENSFSMPTREVEVVDPVTYMQLWNEAVATRNPLAPRPYSDKKIEMTRRGGNAAAYPAVDWLGDMFKSYTTNQRVNLNLSGGGKVARYYVAGSLANDTGLMRVDERNNFNNNISLQSIQLRSNINIDVTKSTELGVRFSGTFEDYSGPIDGGSTLYKKALVANPVLFPKYYDKRAEEAQIDHILFGNAGEGNYLNPYADMVKGYKEYSRMNLVAQMELRQRLDFLTEGLNARALLNTTRYSYFDVSRYYNPFYYALGNYDQVEDTYTLACLNPETGTEYLNYAEGARTSRLRPTSRRRSTTTAPSASATPCRGSWSSRSPTASTPTRATCRSRWPIATWGWPGASPTPTTAATSWRPTSATTARSVSRARSASDSSRRWAWGGSSPMRSSSASGCARRSRCSSSRARWVWWATTRSAAPTTASSTSRT